MSEMADCALDQVMTTDEMRKGFGTAAGKAAQVAAYHKTLTEAANEIDRLQRIIDSRQAMSQNEAYEAAAVVAESLVWKQSKHVNSGEPFKAHMHWEDIAAAIRSEMTKEMK